MTPGTRWPETRAARGIVAAPHALASAAGVAALRRGGNALDAAVAAATTIAVVYPHMNSIGGDNVWLLHDAGRARVRALLGISEALFEHALAHARDGFPPSAGQRRVTAGARDLFAGEVDAGVRRTLWRTERFVQPDLAATLARVAAHGGDEFYRGALAARIVAGAAAAGGLAGGSDPRADGAALGW